jgi:hypothetical protein
MSRMPLEADLGLLQGKHQPTVQLDLHHRHALIAHGQGVVFESFDQRLTISSAASCLFWGLIAQETCNVLSVYVSVHPPALRHRSPCTIHPMGLAREWEECSTHAIPHSF